MKSRGMRVLILVLAVAAMAAAGAGVWQIEQRIAAAQSAAAPSSPMPAAEPAERGMGTSSSRTIKSTPAAEPRTMSSQRRRSSTATAKATCSCPRAVSTPTEARSSAGATLTKITSDAESRCPDFT